MNTNQQFLIYQSPYMNPYINLSVEEYFLYHYKKDSLILFLYRNSPCVVIGRYQNPWKECRPDYLMKKGIPLLRRISGGGAVYHDEGNINICIISNNLYISPGSYLSMILKTINFLGISGVYQNKHNLMIDGYKVSGNAFRITKDRSLYHGTLLLCTHLKNLTSCLIPEFTDQMCKGGVSSVRSPVINLSSFDSSITIDKVIMAFVSVFSRITHTRSLMGFHSLLENNDNLNTTIVVHPEISEEFVPETENEIIRNRKISKLILKNKSHDWIYGNTPPSEININLKAKPDKILNCTLYLINGRISHLFIPEYTHVSGILLKDIQNRPFTLKLYNTIVKKMKKLINNQKFVLSSLKKGLQ